MRDKLKSISKIAHEADEIRAKWKVVNQERLELEGLLLDAENELINQLDSIGEGIEGSTIVDDTYMIVKIRAGTWRLASRGSAAGE